MPQSWRSPKTPPDAWQGWKTQRQRNGRAASDQQYRKLWPALAPSVLSTNQYAALEPDTSDDLNPWFDDTAGSGIVILAPEEIQQAQQKALIGEKQMLVNQLQAAKKDNDGSHYFAPLIDDFTARIDNIAAKIFANKPHRAQL